MAKITVIKGNNRVLMEANYFTPGSISTAFGALFLYPVITGMKFTVNFYGNARHPDFIILLMPYILPVLGTIFFFGGLMAMGTSQVISYDGAEKAIYYGSTIAFFFGHKAMYPVDGLKSIDYVLYKIHHTGNKGGGGPFSSGGNLSGSDGAVYTSYESIVRLSYFSKKTIDLPKISHSESLEEGISLIAEALSVDFERRVNESSDTSLF